MRGVDARSLGRRRSGGGHQEPRVDPLAVVHRPMLALFGGKQRTEREYAALAASKSGTVSKFRNSGEIRRLSRFCGVHRYPE